MSIGLGILFGRLVQASKILFDEHLHTRLRLSLNAHPIAFGPFVHDILGDDHANGLTIESGGNRVDVERTFQQIKERVPGGKLNE